MQTTHLTERYEIYGFRQTAHLTERYEIYDDESHTVICFY